MNLSQETDAGQQSFGLRIETAVMQAWQGMRERTSVPQRRMSLWRRQMTVETCSVPLPSTAAIRLLSSSKHAPVRPIKVSCQKRGLTASGIHNRARFVISISNFFRALAQSDFRSAQTAIAAATSSFEGRESSPQSKGASPSSCTASSELSLMVAICATRQERKETALLAACLPSRRLRLDVRQVLWRR